MDLRIRHQAEKKVVIGGIAVVAEFFILHSDIQFIQSPDKVTGQFVAAFHFARVAKKHVVILEFRWSGLVCRDRLDYF
jgi:hypothetical protein